MSDIKRLPLSSHSFFHVFQNFHNSLEVTSSNVTEGQSKDRDIPRKRTQETAEPYAALRRPSELHSFFSYSLFHPPEALAYCLPHWKTPQVFQPWPSPNQRESQTPRKIRVYTLRATLTQPQYTPSPPVPSLPTHSPFAQ